jgi:phosphoribosyl-ATP pyrophosphohydrolase
MPESARPPQSDDDPPAAPDTPDAKTVLGTLWAGIAVHASPPDVTFAGAATAAAAPDAMAEQRVRRIARAFGLHAEHCVIGLIAEDRAALIRESASTLASLLQIWAERSVSPEAVWTELDRRTQVGELLLSLNSMPTRRAGRAISRPWKIRSTKLP